MNTAVQPPSEISRRIEQCPERIGRVEAISLATLIRDNADRLPLPARGETRKRWQALAAVAERDLGVAKLFEAHVDALAIIQELQFTAYAQAQSWGVWAAEGGAARVELTRRSGDHVELHGTKLWCSGAAQVSHALITAWEEDRGPFLVAIPLQQPGIQISSDAWSAVGMANTATATVTLHGARGKQVGAEKSYLLRAGFWQGGAGIAACWYGGALALARTLRAHARAHSADLNPHVAAHLGAVDVALGTARAALHEAAAWIDAHPAADASVCALRVRAAVELAAQSVLLHTGNALGPAAFCNDATYARMAADLPVFLRQSHGERDLAALAAKLVASTCAKTNDDWTL